MSLVGLIATVFVELIKAVKAADGDAEKEQEALLAAQERLYRLSIKAKFG